MCNGTPFRVEKISPPVGMGVGGGGGGGVGGGGRRWCFHSSFCFACNEVDSISFICPETSRKQDSGTGIDFC